jgi:type IV pilus assembly protein PilB
VSKGWVSEEDLVVSLSKQLSIPFIRLSSYSVNRGALKLIPKEVAERYLFFPFDEDENNISIAMSDPLNTEALDSIEKRIPLLLQIFLSTVSEIRDAIDLYYEAGAPEGELKGR